MDYSFLSTSGKARLALDGMPNVTSFAVVTPRALQLVQSRGIVSFVEEPGSSAFSATTSQLNSSGSRMARNNNSSSSAFMQASMSAKKDNSGKLLSSPLGKGRNQRRLTVEVNRLEALEVDFSGASI